MAPSNLSQVFIANDISDTTNGTMLDGSTFSVQATNNVAAGTLVGVWNTKTNAYILTDMSAATGPIQVVQTMLTGNPIASPLIDPKSIVRIKYTPYTVTVKASTTLTCGIFAAGEFAQVKVAIRTAPTAYEFYANPNNPALDLTGEGYVFPLLGNFSAGRTLIPICEINSGTAATNATAIKNAIEGNPKLNAIFNVTTSTADVTITARHAGVVFDLTVVDQDGGNPGFSQSVTGFNAGSGNYWQAISDEKSMRAKYGNFNRMYFPMSFPEFATVGNTYEVVEISYTHDWPSSTGIARAGELNNIKIYNKVAVEGATKADLVFLGSDSSDWGSAAVERLF
jgi:hypothetical protein